MLRGDFGGWVNFVNKFEMVKTLHFVEISQLLTYEAKSSIPSTYTSADNFP